MKSHLALRSTLGLLVAAALWGHACSKASGSLPDGGDSGSLPDSGDSGGAPDSGLLPDGGRPDAGPPRCTADQQCGPNRWCEKTSGVCRDAKPCPQGQGNCDYQSDPSSADYCGGKACYCDPGDSACKPLHAPCTACSNNAECGNDAFGYDYPADCVGPDAGFAAGSVCIPRIDSRTHNSCPPGYATPTSGAYCVPGGGHCGGVGQCHSDQDCDPHGATPICDGAHQLCVAACTFDLKTGDSNCPTGLVCNLTPILATLPPQDPNYGKGHCAAPCTSATACGSGLVCRSEGIDHPVMRCGLPPPECLGDVECPLSPSTHSVGYCDLAAHQCKTDCRSVADCASGYLCTSNTCVAETCLQGGGAGPSCNYGQFCCGETDSPSPCPAGVDAGACYDKPPNPWCESCGKPEECQTGAYPPGRDGGYWPNWCIAVSQNSSVCALSCETGHDADCPRSWGCKKLYQGCQTSSDCSNGSGAHCENPDGGGNGLCTCAADADADCGQNVHCLKGKCIISQVCAPSCP